MVDKMQKNFASAADDAIVINCIRIQLHVWSTLPSLIMTPSPACYSFAAAPTEDMWEQRKFMPQPSRHHNPDPGAPAKRIHGQRAARPTQAELARHLGVSQATLSRVFSGQGPVSKKLRDRVNTAIVDFGYKPNLYARGLVSRKTRTIGVLATATTVPAHLIRLTALTSRLIGSGWTVINALTDGRAETEQDALDGLEGRMIEGLICLHRHHVSDAVLTERFGARGVPVVVYSCELIPGIDTLAAEIAGGIRDVVAHLVERGHRRLGLILMASSSPEMQRREIGFREAMARAGLEVHEPWVVRQRMDRSSGAAAAGLPNLDSVSDYDLGQLATRRLLAQDRRPTALVCASDCMAIGALHALREAGLRVPEDMAVTGYDGLDQSRFSSPPLTTVEIDYTGLGRAAAERLLARIEDDDPTPPTHTTVPGRFVARRSSDALL